MVRLKMMCCVGFLSCLRYLMCKVEVRVILLMSLELEESTNVVQIKPPVP